MNVSSPFEAAPAPAKPFTAIVYLYLTECSDEGVCTSETFNMLEIGAFDARDAWTMAQSELDAQDAEENSAYIAGVCGGSGWAPRPAWVPVWSVMTPEQREAHQNAALDSVSAQRIMDRVVDNAARF